MKSLAVRVLGDFGVDGVEPHALGSKKARAALHLLALAQGQGVRSGLLIDALWGDAPPSSPEDQLAVLMSRLRSVLGRDRIEHRDGGYLVRYDWLDAAELAALTDEMNRRHSAGNIIGAAAAARIALTLVGSAEPAPAAGEWAQVRAADLDRLISRARRTAAAMLGEAGDWTAAADAASAALERDPYDEASLRTLLRAHVAGGQVAAALAAYAEARERLADELGADPAPETAALYMAILRGDQASRKSPGTQARPDPTATLVGRDGELAFLDAVAARTSANITPGSVRSAEIVLVDGTAGIGKTTLLRAWAARLMTAGHTVLMASCGQLDRAMPLDAVLRALAAALRRIGSDAAADVLGGDASLLTPLLRPASSPSGSQLADNVLGPRVLYAALARVFARLTDRGPVVLIVDDAHLVGQPLPDLLDFVLREGIPLLVVAAVRSGEGPPLPATAQVHLDVLDHAAATELVGLARVDELYARSKGHPLFLTELAQQAAGAELPASLVESVSQRCDELGPAGALLRTAAVIGPELDADLLAALLGRPIVALLDDAERAVAAQFLTEEAGSLRFRHELVRDALAMSASAGRAAMLHRQAGRVLARRPGIDPVIVAEHARLGGDLELSATALCDAAGRAAERFDHAAAEALLDQAITLHPTPAAWLGRARVRTQRRHYGEALADVESAAEVGAAALEVGAWASYFDRRFAQAAQFAEDGALAATDQATQARCLAVGGRTKHAAGDLDRAEVLLGEAFSLAEGTDRVTAAAWLGVLRSHQSRTTEALSLLRPAMRGQIGVEHTSATLHALLFSGHAHALAGRPAAALDSFASCTAEVERRQVPRFAGRSVNFAAWVLRNLGASEQASDMHAEALQVARHHGTAEVEIAALEDLAELCLDADDVEGSAVRLAAARELLVGDLVFGWRLDCKHRLISGRLALHRDEPELAREHAVQLEAAATALGVPRYACVARLLRHRADRALSLPVDLAAVEADLDELDRTVAIEAWWWTGDLAADFASRVWLDRAADRARRLARHAGSRGDLFLAVSQRRLAVWAKACG